MTPEGDILSGVQEDNLVKGKNTLYLLTRLQDSKLSN